MEADRDQRKNKGYKKISLIKIKLFSVKAVFHGLLLLFGGLKDKLF